MMKFKGEMSKRVLQNPLESFKIGIFVQLTHLHCTLSVNALYSGRNLT